MRNVGGCYWLRQSACLGLGMVLWLTGCTVKPSGNLQGYIEGEYVYVAGSLGGTLEQRPVSRGAWVKAGDLLFTLEQASERAALQEAEDRVGQAQARLDNLRKGRRPSEIASIEGRLEQAKATTALWDAELTRRKQLHATGVISIAELDQAQHQRDANQGSVTSLAADLETARLGARDDEIRAGEAEVAAAQAALARAKWAVDQKTRSAPAAGQVQDVLYRTGEWVPAGNPVVCLLPPENVRVRFFVPQTRLAGVQVGAPVQVLIDGATNPVPARVSFISTQAEFTPPVIYSRETRAKLVFMVEAVFDSESARRLHPGQPVDVRLATEAAPAGKQG